LNQDNIKHLNRYIISNEIEAVIKKSPNREIPRWQLEGRSRKRTSYSEILERHWRHILQAKLWPLHTSSQCRAPPLHIKRRNQEGPWAASHPCPDGLWRHRWVLFYFMRPLWWDNYRTTSEAPSPGLETETDTKIIKTETSFHLNLEVFFYFLFFILFYFYIYITFIYLFFIFIIIFILFIFYFQSSLCLSNACSAYCRLVH
jgi:hypothetical protein